MNELERKVRDVRRRLVLGRALCAWGACLSIACILWGMLLLSDRLLGLELPLAYLAAGGLLVSLIVALVIAAHDAVDRVAAATAIDLAAGLRERVSTSLALSPADDDAFARAVRADALSVVRGVTTRRAAPVRWTRSLSRGSAALFSAALLTLVPEYDLLGRKEARAAAEAQTVAAQQVQAVVAEQASAMARSAALSNDADLQARLKELSALAHPEPGKDADAVRRDAVKKMDRLEDALREKSEAERFKAMEEMRKRLSRMVDPRERKTQPSSSLLQNLASGDMQRARKAVEALREQLAKRVREGKLNPADAEKARKQLDDLARKLEQTANQEQTRRELANMGLSDRDQERILSALSKKDPRQQEQLAKELAQRLKDRGLTEEQVRRMLNKMAAREQANQSLREMSKCASGACNKLAQGDAAAALSELSTMAGMLGEAEQLEQQLNEIEAQLASLDEGREKLNQQAGSSADGKCSQCNGAGFLKNGKVCSGCNGTGQCRGGPGGKGGLKAGRGPGGSPMGEPTDTTAEGYANRKAALKVGPGATVISQQIVPDMPMSGRSRVELQEAARAAENRATDALKRDRIPRAYRKGVKNYFERLGQTLDSTEETDPDRKSEESGGGGDSADAPG